jgi:RNA polymerase sigma-70 factor (ECF subfamily)
MWPDAEQTHRLIDRARSGDSEAIDELLAAHRKPLRRAVELRLDPALTRREDASDVVQKALLDAHRRLQEYLTDPKMPFHLWLRQIAQDRIIDTHRRHRAAARRSIDQEQPVHPPAWADESSAILVAQLIDPDRTPGSEAVMREMQQRLHTVIATLDETDREIILMRYFEQLSNQEIAGALGLTEAAASMRHLRAIRRLREALTPP